MKQGDAESPMLRQDQRPVNNIPTAVQTSPMEQGDASPGHSKPAPVMRQSYSEMSIEQPQFQSKDSPMSPTVAAGDSDDEDEDSDDTVLKGMASERIHSMFGLPSHERLLGEFPCYLLRIVTLPGWLYLTEHTLCFYAALPGKEDGPQKTGYLCKKNHRTSPRTHRYYFQLKDTVLSWYDSAENMYEPLGSLDLRDATGVRPSRIRTFAFQIMNNKRRQLMLIADSEVSRKEWMDELQRAVFMARNSGTSVRLVMPFSKIEKLNKTAAYNFAQYIRVRMMDSVSAEGDADEYYFAYFKDINAAFRRIQEQWNRGSTVPRISTIDTMTGNEATSTDTITLQNGLGNNASSISAFLIGALSGARQSDDGDLDTTDTPSSLSSTPTSPTFRLVPHDQQTIDPAADKEDENKTTEPRTKGRFRSASTASIRQLARQSLGLTLPSFANNQVQATEKNSSDHQFLDPSSTQSSFSSVKSNTVRHSRSGSVRELILHPLRSTATFGDLEALPGKSLVARTPSFWISPDYRGVLKQLEPGTGSISAIANTAESDDGEMQRHADEELHKNFPMLRSSENVIAAFTSAVWRSLPYYGRLIFSLNYVCFYSKVLAGRQKLAIPIADIMTVRRLKSRGYYLIHSIGVLAKNMPDEIYFEFSSLESRDRCYALLYFLTTEHDSLVADVNTGITSIKMSDILAQSTEHALPPVESGGPPLLSTLSSIEPPRSSAPPKQMHITCLTIGSRGDVQPYIALCKQLMKDGHQCRIASHDEYKYWVEEHGIEFRSIGGDPGELMKLCIDNGFMSYSFIKGGVKFFYTWFETLLSTAWEACQGTDLLIESPSAMVGVHMAEKLGIPYFRSMPFPWTRTTRFPHPFAMQNYTRGRLLYNDMTYVMIDMALWTGTSRYINRFRRKVLGLPATTLERLELWRVPHIYSFSPAVLPPPKDWPDYVHCTGYWFLDNPDMSWKPPAKLLAFLGKKDDARPIIYIGFGSIIVPDPEAVSQTIIDAVLKANVRAIICKGWSSRMSASKPATGAEEESSAMLDRYPGTVYQIDQVPHDWLFPQIHGVVHHGGAGTTAAGLRAGQPTVIKPFFGDQRFWAQRMEELGVGVCVLKLTVDKLSDALVEITQNEALISKAKALGDTIRKENGVKTAIECIYRDMHIAKRTPHDNNNSSSS